MKTDKFTGPIINSVNFLLHYFQFLGFIPQTNNYNLWCMFDMCMCYQVNSLMFQRL